MNVFSTTKTDDSLLIKEKIEQLEENLEICEIYLEEISVKRLLELGVMKWEQVHAIQQKYDLLRKEYFLLKGQLKSVEYHI